MWVEDYQYLWVFWDDPQAPMHNLHLISEIINLLPKMELPGA